MPQGWILKYGDSRDLTIKLTVDGNPFLLTGAERPDRMIQAFPDLDFNNAPRYLYIQSATAGGNSIVFRCFDFDWPPPPQSPYYLPVGKYGIQVLINRADIPGPTPPFDPASVRLRYWPVSGFIPLVITESEEVIP